MIWLHKSKICPGQPLIIGACEAPVQSSLDGGWRQSTADTVQNPVPRHSRVVRLPCRTHCFTWRRKKHRAVLTLPGYCYANWQTQWNLPFHISAVSISASTVIQLFWGGKKDGGQGERVTPECHKNYLFYFMFCFHSSDCFHKDFFFTHQIKLLRKCLALEIAEQSQEGFAHWISWGFNHSFKMWKHC